MILTFIGLLREQRELQEYHPQLVGELLLCAFDSSCPKILLKPTSVNGLMYFAISRNFGAKIILFFETCKKIHEKNSANELT